MFQGDVTRREKRRVLRKEIHFRDFAHTLRSQSLCAQAVMAHGNSFSPHIRPKLGFMTLRGGLGISDPLRKASGRSDTLAEQHDKPDKVDRGRKIARHPIITWYGRHRRVR